MSPLIILLLAVLIVVGGVLILRLPAALALLAAALLTALLTPSEYVYQHEITRAASRVVEAGGDGTRATLQDGKGKSVHAGRQWVLRRGARGEPYRHVGQAILEVEQRERDLLRVRLQPLEPGLRLAVDDLLIHHALVSAVDETAAEPAGERVARGFGATCGKIGILIALASIIGKCLLESGAAERIVVTIRTLLGDRRAGAALAASGFVMGIPVFFDTVFYLLIPLARALSARTGRNYLLYVMSIIVGATMAHSLVPPTPGPLFVAGELGVTIGLMMLGGLTVGGLAAMAGYAYAVWANGRWVIPLREERPSASAVATPDARPESRARLPSCWLALLPILLPVLLLGGKTIVDLAWSDVPAEQMPRWMAMWTPLLETFGEQNLALALATLVALLLLVRAPSSREHAVRLAVGEALSSAGVIILVTASGGALGHVLRQTNIALAVQDLVPAAGAGLALLCTAFTVTMVVRVAQGSATVAMITGAGIVAPIAASTVLPYHPLYLALAIGCGSKPLPWMNDSGFWIVGRMSGMTPVETLRTFTAGLTIMGFVGFVVVIAGALLVPLV